MLCGAADCFQHGQDPRDSHDTLSVPKQQGSPGDSSNSGGNSGLISIFYQLASAGEVEESHKT